jgi:hypothetical protein
MKLHQIIPTLLVKQAYEYETDADVPLPILKNPIYGAFTRPDQVMSRIGDDGGEGGMGKFTTGLLQTGGAATGGFGGYLLGGLKKNKLAKTLGALTGTYLGLGTGGATAGLMHNEQSRNQFAKTLRGALSEDDTAKIPPGILQLLDKGNTDKFKEMIPNFVPELMQSPYVKALIDSQTER